MQEHLQVGNVLGFVASWRSVSERQRQRYDSIMTLMERYELPMDLRRQLRKWAVRTIMCAFTCIGLGYCHYVLFTMCHVWNFTLRSAQPKCRWWTAMFSGSYRRVFAGRFL